MVQSITPTELKQRLESGDDLMVIDVRMPWELEITQLDFARHIVMDEIPDALDQIPQDQEVVFLCRSGGRSQQVAEFLTSRGWDANKLYNLEGGILRWARDVDPSLPQVY